LDDFILQMIIYSNLKNVFVYTCVCVFVCAHMCGEHDDYALWMLFAWLEVSLYFCQPNVSIFSTLT